MNKKPLKYDVGNIVEVILPVKVRISEASTFKGDSRPTWFTGVVVSGEEVEFGLYNPSEED